MTKKIPLQLTEYYDDELLTDLYSYRGIRRHKKADREKVFEDVFRISVAADTYREGHCYLVPIPFGLDPERYALYENGRRLVRGTAFTMIFVSLETADIRSGPHPLFLHPREYRSASHRPHLRASSDRIVYAEYKRESRLLATCQPFLLDS